MFHRWLSSCPSRKAATSAVLKNWRHSSNPAAHWAVAPTGHETRKSARSRQPVARRRAAGLSSRPNIRRPAGPSAPDTPCADAIPIATGQVAVKNTLWSKASCET
eukprot:scaffold10220_cov144-Isochrysis_galbana.AAC.12